MILFLDTVSSLPEFSIIEDSKVIDSLQIMQNDNDKMSDCLIPAYLTLEKKFSLDSNLSKLIINTGPGSYTALRVGISFFSGLSISKKIQLIGISCLDIFLYLISSKDYNKSAFFIKSSNNQNFLYVYSSIEKKYILSKVEKNFFFNRDVNFVFNRLYSNYNFMISEKKLISNFENIKLSFAETISNNILEIKSSSDEKIIKPIYYSDNKILN